jgi:hypothetical protein
MARIDIPNSSRRRSGRGLRYALILILLAIAGTALWSWLTLSWAYSDGTRAGVLQKYSHRGWLCKTNEGDLAQYVVAGVSPQMWQFSVRDPAVSAQLDKLAGSQVQLHYTEHPGIPSTCFADTRYFVDHVTLADAAVSGTKMQPPAVPPATPPPPVPAPAPPAAPATSP